MRRKCDSALRLLRNLCRFLRIDLKRGAICHRACGLFDPPVPVTVTGSLLWDGEHGSPNTVGPEGLQPAKAWEIHPIKQLAER
jgi:hypothetical protein